MPIPEENIEKNNKKQKKYLWLGYGNYSGMGVTGPINPGNIRADPSIFDKLFELFGVKDKHQKDTEENNKN